MVTYHRMREQRDVIKSREPLIADFVDTQLKKAREVIERDLAKPSDTPPAPAPAENAAGKEDGEKPAPDATSRGAEPLRPPVLDGASAA
jgi:hypothetical protein